MKTLIVISVLLSSSYVVAAPLVVKNTTFAVDAYDWNQDHSSALGAVTHAVISGGAVGAALEPSDGQMTRDDSLAWDLVRKHIVKEAVRPVYRSDAKDMQERFPGVHFDTSAVLAPSLQIKVTNVIRDDRPGRWTTRPALYTAQALVTLTDGRSFSKDIQNQEPSDIMKAVLLWVKGLSL